MSGKSEDMKLLAKLSTSLNRRDEAPYQELTQRIVDASDKNAMCELTEERIT